MRAAIGLISLALGLNTDGRERNLGPEGRVFLNESARLLCILKMGSTMPLTVSDHIATISEEYGIDTVDGRPGDGRPGAG